MAISYLEREISNVSSFIKNDELREAFRVVAKLIKEENQDNIELMCPAMKIDTQEYNIGEEHYCEDYEILTGSYEVELSGNEYLTLTEDERQAKVEELEEKKDELENSLDDEALTDEQTEELEQQLETITSDIETLENADFEYDEIYWNVTWNYFGDDIDLELASRLGLGVIQRNSDDMQFLTLLGCGMDLTPKIMAYQALRYGYIDEEFKHKLRDISYCKYVMHNDVFKEVMQELGLAHLIDITQERAEQRMQHFNERMNTLTKLREEGTDKNIVAIGAMMAFAKSQTE
ncbi:MAG: hypothetical protein GY730_06700 [bacterium]|nr:hypothetical protein [bacterium]